MIYDVARKEEAPATISVKIGVEFFTILKYEAFSGKVENLRCGIYLRKKIVLGLTFFNCMFYMTVFNSRMHPVKSWQEQAELKIYLIIFNYDLEIDSNHEIRPRYIATNGTNEHE